MTVPSRCSENEGNALFWLYFAFHVCYGTDSLNRFDEIVNRNPCTQRHVQAKITRDIEMIGSEGEALRKIFEDKH